MEEKIKELISDEFSIATRKFNSFASAHEGQNVIREEVEELEEEVKNIIFHTNELWNYVKLNDKEAQKYIVNIIYYLAISTIKEAIQVAAMCKRFEKDLGGNNK